MDGVAYPSGASFPEALKTYSSTMAMHRTLVSKCYSGVCDAVSSHILPDVAPSSSSSSPSSQHALLAIILEAHLKLHKILFENLFYNTWDAVKQLLAAYDDDPYLAEHRRTSAVQDGGAGSIEHKVAEIRRQLLEQPTSHIKFITYNRPSRAPLTHRGSTLGAAECPPDRQGEPSSASQTVRRRLEQVQQSVARRTIALSPDFTKSELLEAIRYGQHDIGCSVLLLPPTCPEEALRHHVIAQYFAPEHGEARVSGGARPTGGLAKLAEIAGRFAAATALKPDSPSASPVPVDFDKAASVLRRHSTSNLVDSDDADLQRLLELLEESAPAPPHRTSFPFASPTAITPIPALPSAASIGLVFTAGVKRGRDEQGSIDVQSPTSPGYYDEMTMMAGDDGRRTVRGESQVVAYQHSQEESGEVSEEHPDEKQEQQAKRACEVEAEEEGGMEEMPPRMFQLSLSLKDDKAAVVSAIRDLGGVVDRRSAYSPEATHFVVAEGLVERTEKYLSFCAARKAIVTPRYVLDSLAKGSWIVDDRDYNINPQNRVLIAAAPTRGGGGQQRSALRRAPRGFSSCPLAFEGWNVWLFATKAVAPGIQTILAAGGCSRVTVFHVPVDSSAAGVEERERRGKATRSDMGPPCLGATDEQQVGSVTHFLVEARMVPTSHQGPSSSSSRQMRAVPPTNFPPKLLETYEAKVFTLELLYHVLCLAKASLFTADGLLIDPSGVPPTCRVTPSSRPTVS